MCARIIRPRAYAQAARIWTFVQIVFFLGWIALIPLHFSGRMWGIAALAGPVLVMMLVLGKPTYAGFWLFLSGANDLEKSRRWWRLKLMLAPMLAASLSAFIIGWTSFRWSFSDVLQAIENARSIDMAYKFTHPLIVCGVNALFLATVCMIDAPRRSGRRATGSAP